VTVNFRNDTSRGVGRPPPLYPEPMFLASFGDAAAAPFLENDSPSGFVRGRGGLASFGETHAPPGSLTAHVRGDGPARCPTNEASIRPLTIVGRDGSGRVLVTWPPRAFASATSTGRPGSSFARSKAARPGQAGSRSSPARNPPRGQGCGHAEPQVVVPVLRPVPVPVRRPAVPRLVVPATAPDHPVRGPGRPPRRIVRLAPASAYSPSSPPV
jgi:hypothetical protein